MKKRQKTGGKKHLVRTLAGRILELSSGRRSLPNREEGTRLKPKKKKEGKEFIEKK